METDPARVPAKGAARLLPVLALAFLAPVCAEYLSGYDTSTGDPLELAGQLFVFVPLYGCAALLIRETARRFGLGRPGVLALAAALGIMQAGIIDQSMFSSAYRDIDYWEAMIAPTWIAPPGISSATALAFVTGHLFMSFTAPIVLVEGLNPRLADRPWLRLPGLAATAVLYLAAAWFVLRWHLDTETDHASRPQLAGAAAVAAILVVIAFTVGRKRSAKLERRVPPLWLLALAAAAASFTATWTYTWAGFAYAAALLIGGGAALAYWSRSTAWDRRHVIALATGALAATALGGFLTDPIGDVEPVAKYAHNAIATAGVLALGWWAVRRNRAIPLRGTPPCATLVPWTHR
jgi:hypothetical protein